MAAWPSRGKHRERAAIADPPALIIAGPTSIGKSRLALDLAKRVGGAVINADAMQVYRDLRVLTARPGPEEEGEVPHRLYGVRPGRCAGDVAWWRQAALAAMNEAWSAGRLPILCGGSGLYLSALAGGLAPLPPVDATAREEARTLVGRIGPAALHTRLAAVDPDTAGRLRPTDTQRVARAWEVWRSSGIGLRAWQGRPGNPAPWRFGAILLAPERAALRAAIADRFARMMEAGALEEVQALLAQGLRHDLPIMRALSVPELAAHVRGEFGLEEAIARAITATRQYAKRQSTWFQHHRPAEAGRVMVIIALYQDWTQLSECSRAELVNFVHNMVDE